MKKKKKKRCVLVLFLKLLGQNPTKEQKLRNTINPTFFGRPTHTPTAKPKKVSPKLARV